MRGALRVAVLGVALVLLAAAFDVEALYSGGIVFVVVAATAAAWVAASSRGLRVSRAVPRAAVPEDEPFAVTVTVRGGRLPPPGVEVQDGVRPGPVPVRLRRRQGGSARTAAGEKAPRGKRTVGESTATVSFARRGRHTLPPPAVRVADPFALAARVVSSGDGAPPDRVLVLPRLAEQDPDYRGRAGLSDGGSRASRGLGPETDIEGLRPHRPGTPASRIHWPAYARGAGLLERVLRADGDGLPLVVLDPPAAGRPTDFDETVRAAASRTVRLARGGGVAVLLPGDRRPTTVDRTLAAWPGLHARFALVGPPAPEDARAVVAGAAAAPRSALPRWWRLLAWTAPATVATVTWAALFRPHLGAGVTPALLLGLALGVAVLAIGAARPSRGRSVALAGAAGAGVLVALLCPGLPVRLVLPTGWDELAPGLVRGVGAMPDVLVPYHRPSEWIRWTMLLGGTSLLVAGPLLAAWPRRDGTAGFPIAAAAILVLLYGAGVVAHSPPEPYVGGAVVAVGLLALLRGPSIVRGGGRGVASAVGLAAFAAAVAVLLAPALDAGHGWVDVRTHKTAAGTATFNWNQTYAKLNWPRTGKTVLTVTTRRAAYWKATNLERFDGREWRQVSNPLNTYSDDGQLMLDHPQWVQGMHVSVGSLRTSLFVGAGTTLVVYGAGSPAIPSGQGTYMTAPGSTLRSGDTYTTTGYIPHPTASQLRRAGTAYPADVARDARLVLPPYLRGGYRRTTALASRLAAQATSPYDLVQRVIQRVQDGATYSTDPGVHTLPLDAFLFDDRRGYCQQFSGAVALLLRMGGVPARVAAGFAPGLEAGGAGPGEKVFTVADLDAHAWVEVYFPTYGWVTFDPTPPSGTARTEPTVAEAVSRVTPTGRALSQTGSTTEVTGTASVATPGPGAALVAGGAAVLLLAIAAAAVLVGRRRPVPADAALTELARALRRSGRPVPAHTTLAELEHLLDAYPVHPARGYLRALSDARFARPTDPGRLAGTVAGPSMADRRGLRRALAAGGGPRRWLRSWWALPPRLASGAARRPLGQPAGPPR